MSDEDRDEYDSPREGESEHEWMQRMTSPELRWLDLFRRLTTRVEASESRIETDEQEARRRAEETQRNIDFIVQQQAQFTADMQRMSEVQARAEEKWENTAKGINALLAIAEIHEGEIKALAETQAQAARMQAEAHSRTDRQMAETDERLNALVNVVERLISERRNGSGGDAG